MKFYDLFRSKHPAYVPNQLLRIMKLTFILMIALILQVAAKGSAQSITLVEKNASLNKIFKELYRQCGSNFIYTSQMLEGAKLIDANLKGVSLKEALDFCFRSQPLEYSIENNTIIVVRKENTLKVFYPNPEALQLRTIKGVVVDEKNKPLPGATVKIKGTNRGTTTDMNGEFELKGVEDKVILSISFIGYMAKDVHVNDTRRLTIVLEEIKGSLDQVVVVAYGTSKKKDLTGSVSHLGVQDMNNAPMGSSIQSMMQGKAAGVNVMIQSASPSSPVSVIIRGASSLSGDNQPLWVIDGVPQYNASTSGNIANTLYNLNLNDVESVDVLKDASATALYGSRGASGVVLVTTKRGREGTPPTIEFSSRYGTQVMDKSKLGVLVADQYKNLSRASVREAIMTVGGLDYFTRQFIDVTKYNEKFKNISSMSKNWITDDLFKPDAFLNGDTDWWRLMTQNAATQDYSLSLRGGTKQSSYYTSFFMKDQQGVVKGGNSKTYGLRFNFESSLQEKLKLGVNLNANVRNTNDKDRMLGVILDMRPDFPAYNPDGSINRISLYTRNPLLTLQDKSSGAGKSGTGTLFLEYDILKELKLRTTGTVDYSNSKTDQFTKAQYAGDVNARTINQVENTALVWENTLNYFKTIGKHDVNALLGFSMEKDRGEGFLAKGTNFPDDEVLTDLGSAAIKSSIGSSLFENSLMSAFARINYKFNNRYLLTGTVRKDGSSRFGPDKRWGFFPSMAAGWIVTEENFMKPLHEAVSYLKLRASIGKTGSQNLGNYDWQTLMGSGSFNGLPGIVPTTIGNDILQWESQNQIDLGLDFGLVGDRVRGTLGWYEKKVNNLLYSDPVPISSSFTSVTQNIGGIRNRGLEFDIRADVIKHNGLTLTLDFNIARNTGILEKLNNTDQYFGGGDYDIFRTDVGSRLGEFYGYKYAGRIFKTQEEIIALKPTLPTGYHGSYRDAYENPGDLYLMDLNGDGKITTADRTFLGNANPDVYGGFGSTLIFGGFYFNATFSYSLGGKRLYDLEKTTSGDMNVYNVPTMALDSWTMAGDNGALPRITYYGRGENNIMTDRFLHDASFVRLSSLNMSYRLPEKVMGVNKLFRTIEFSFQATNLFTITKYPGMDPQGNFDASSSSTFMAMGVDNSTYPQARTYSLGLKFILK